MYLGYRIVGSRGCAAKALGFHSHCHGLRPADTVYQHRKYRLHGEYADFQPAHRERCAHLIVFPHHTGHQVKRRQNAVGELRRQLALVQKTCDKEITVGCHGKQDAQPRKCQQPRCQLQRCVQVLRHGGTHSVRHGRKCLHIHRLPAAASGIIQPHNKQTEGSHKRGQQQGTQLFDADAGAKNHQQQAAAQHQQIQADKIFKRKQNHADKHSSRLDRGVPTFQHLRFLTFCQGGVFEMIDFICPLPG